MAAAEETPASTEPPAEPQDDPNPTQNGTAQISVSSDSAGDAVNGESEEKNDEEPSKPKSSFFHKLRRRGTQIWRDEFPEEDRPGPYITEKVMDREDGYPRFAQFISTSDNVLICRKFGWLHSRLLLYKQDELAYLERKLHEMDVKDSNGDSVWRLYSREFDNSRQESPRKALLKEIDEKLKEYDALVDRIDRVSHRKPPSERSFASLFKWIWNEKPVINKEFEFIFRKHDLVAIKEDVDESWFDDAIAVFLSSIPGRFVEWIFSTKEERSQPGFENAKIFSPTKVNTFARMVIAIIAALMMVIPVVLLCLVNLKVASQLGIVLCWICVFAIAVAVLTPARRFEVVAATAAYAAVLVVFLGNLQGGQQVKKN